MNKADEALADVRRWLCGSLSDGDAGKVCGMLSVVSRRIAEIEEENAKLRVERDHWHVEQVHAYGNWEDAHKRTSELEIENAKLRKQVTRLQSEWESERDYADQMEAKEKRAVAENDKLRELFYEAWEWMQRARYDHSIRVSEMDEIGVKAIKMGFPDYELGIEVRHV